MPDWDKVDFRTWLSDEECKIEGIREGAIHIKFDHAKRSTSGNESNSLIKIRPFEATTKSCFTGDRHWSHWKANDLSISKSLYEKLRGVERLENKEIRIADKIVSIRRRQN